MKNSGFKWLMIGALVMFSCTNCNNSDGSNASGQSIQHKDEGAGDDSSDDDDIDDSWKDSGTGGTHQGTNNADSYNDADTLQ